MLANVSAASGGLPAPGDELGALQRDLEQVLLQLVVVLEVDLLLALLHLVQRRLRDVDVAALDQLRHLPVEEREQQRADVRAVDVRVGHDDDAVIAQLVGVVLVLAEAGAERRDQRDDLLRAHELVEARALDVEDLAAQRQDRLELAVAALLRASRRRNRPRRGRARTARDRAPGSRRACRAAPSSRARPCGASARAPCAPPRARARRRRSCVQMILASAGLLEQEVGELRRRRSPGRSAGPPRRRACPWSATRTSARAP